MKKLILILALAMATPIAWAQESKTTTTEKEKTTTTTTTTGTGTIAEYVAGKTVVLKEKSGPVTYTFGDKVVYVTKSGQTITDADLKTRIKVGSPVSVHYVKSGDGMTVSRVVIDD